MSVSHLIGPVSTIFPVTFSDNKFTSAESPIIIDLNAELGKNANAGQLDNNGPGHFFVEVSEDGPTFGPSEEVLTGKTFRIRGLNVHSIRLTLSNPSIPSSYHIIGSDPGKELITDSGISINTAVAEPPGTVSGLAATDTQIVPAATLGRRALSIANNGAMDVYLAFGGNTPIIGSGRPLRKAGEPLDFTSTLIDEDEIRGISIAPIEVSFQIWSDEV